MTIPQTKHDPGRVHPAWLVGVEVTLLFIGIFALRLALGDDPSEPVLMLLVLPIALLAVSYGIPGAFAGACVASASFVLWAELRDVDATAGAYLTRFAVFFTVAVALGVFLRRAAQRERLRAESERRLIELLESGHEAFISMDSKGAITGWNTIAAESFGWTAEEVIGRTVAETIVPPAQRKSHMHALERFDPEAPSAIIDRRVEFEALHRDGHTFPVELKVTVVSEPRGGVSFHAFLHDISQRKLAEEELRRRAEDMETIASATRDLARSETADEARIAICRAAARIAGAPLTMLYEPSGSAVNLQVTAAHGADVNPRRRAQLDSRSGSAIVFATGEPLFVADVASDVRSVTGPLVDSGASSAYWHPITRDALLVGVLGIGWTEVTSELPANVSNSMSLLAAEASVAIDRAATLERLERIARTDELTGLPNRRAWEEALPRELALAERLGRPLAVAMLDLDHFKTYNDEHGHQAGDRLLKQAASAWRGRLRTTDLLARYGGEEFAVLLPSCDIDQAVDLVDRVRAATPEGESCSAGVAEWTREEGASEMLARADAALYEAKNSGRDATVVARA